MTHMFDMLSIQQYKQIRS